jgi:hypothetical protein
MLVIDFMHKVELGVWKALFTHLICILDAMALLEELDKRYNNNIMWIVIVIVKVGDLKVRLTQVDFGGEYLNV